MPIGSITLSDEEGPRETLAEPPFGAAPGTSVLASCGAHERMICAVRFTRRCRLSPCVFPGSGVRLRMVTAKDGNARHEAGLLAGFTAAQPGSLAPRPRREGRFAGRGS